jgi:hypothetical protein
MVNNGLKHATQCNEFRRLLKLQTNAVIQVMPGFACFLSAMTQPYLRILIGLAKVLFAWRR